MTLKITEIVKCISVFNRVVMSSRKITVKSVRLTESYVYINCKV